VVVILRQEAYLESLATMSDHYERRIAETGVRSVALSQAVRPGRRDFDWIRQRRDLQHEVKLSLRWRDGVQEDAEDTLRAAALALSQEHPDLQDMFLWSDFAEAAMLRSRERMEAKAERRSTENEVSHSVPENDYAIGAGLNYRTWFSQSSGRPVERGPVGASDDVRPPLPDGWQFMTHHGFAVFFLRLGGYRSARQMDDEGWTALHHAIQATVFWDMAHKVCRGLIPMMNRRWICLKTWSGEPACNGSDIMLERCNIVRLLLEHDADIESHDSQGRTPFLHAAGTGVVDVAQALAAAGCDVWAAAYDGRNALNRCAKSSGSMRWCS
jgi:hypothetical protein